MNGGLLGFPRGAERDPKSVCVVLRNDLTVVDGFAFNSVSWEAAAWDTANMWNPKDPARLWAPTQGLYLAIGQWNITTSTSGDYGISIQKGFNDTLNGTVVPNADTFGFGEQQFSSGANYHMATNISIMLFMQPGHFVEMRVEQKTSASRTIDHTATFFQLTRISDAPFTARQSL